MNGRMRIGILGIAVALALVACASKGPTTPKQSVAASETAPGQLSPEVQNLVNNASQRVICKRQSVTGSRVLQRQVCLTQAQMREQEEQANQLMREIRQSSDTMRQAQERPLPQPSSPSPGGH